MRILVIGNNYRISGGAESVFFNTINLLESKGHKVIPFSLRQDNILYSPFEKYFVNTKTKSHNKLYSFEAKRQLQKLINLHKPDIAHIHNIIGGISFSILPILKKFEIPIVATIHDFRLLCPAYIFVNGKKQICEKCKTGSYYHCIFNNCSPLGIKQNFLISMESYFRDIFLPYRKLIDSFIFVSKFQQKKFLEISKDLVSKNYKIYNFSNNFEFCDTKGDYFLYFGRLAREKSIFTLLKCFKDLPDIKLLVVGEGELKSKIIAEKSSNVYVIGYKSGDELKKLIKESGFVIASSECYETNSMVVVEANAFGKPVIGSNIGAISELIIPEKTGYLYEVKNASHLKNIVISANEMPINLYKRMAKNAFDFSSQNFSPTIHYENLIGVYKDTMAKRINK